MRLYKFFYKLSLFAFIACFTFIAIGCRTTGETSEFNISPITSYYKRHNINVGDAYVNDINYNHIENSSSSETLSLSTSELITQPEQKGMFGLHSKKLHDSPDNLLERFELLYPFIEYKKSVGRQKEYWFRPLFYLSNNSLEDKTKLDILYPLGRYYQAPNEKQLFLYPLFYYDEFKTPDGRTDLDSFFFPLIFYGKETYPKAPNKLKSIMHKDKNGDGKISYWEFSGARTQFDLFDTNSDDFITEDEAKQALAKERVLTYFAVVPFGGMLRDFLFREYIEFFMFPLYYHSMESGFESYYLIFPIFHWGHGDGRRSFAVFPLYSQDIRRYIVEDKQGNLVEGGKQYERYTILWPLINYTIDWSLHKVPGADGKVAYEYKKYADTFYIFPFYAQQITQNSKTYSVLFPFFTYRYDKSKDMVSWDILYPFFHYSSGIGYHALRLFPLFESYDIIRKNGSEESVLRILGPIIWIEDEQNRLEDIHKTFLCGIFWHKFYEKFDAITGKKSAQKRKVKIWPFFGFDSEYDDSFRMEFLSLLPLSEIPDHDNVWAPFWRLFFYESIPSEETTRFNIIGPLVRYEKKPDRTQFDLFPLIQYRDNRNKDGESNESSFDFLYGLLGGGEDNIGSYIKLLWFFKIHTSKE